MEQEEDVPIKFEDEMGIFVKEEESLTGVASTSAYDDDTSINLADLLVESRPQFMELEEFQKELLVYTKKLDDMSVWKSLREYKYSKDILNMVVTESKPAFPRIYKKKKKRKSIVKFNKFTSNLQLYNEMIAVKDRRRLVNNYAQKHINIQSSKAKINNESPKQHVTISLDDYNGGDVLLADDDTNKISTDEEETDIISTVTVDTNIAPISSVVPVNHQKSTEQLINTRYIVIIHTWRSLYDVYFVNNAGLPTEFYKIDKHNISSISNDTIKKVYVTNCCWFKRDMRLKYMNLENCSSIMFTFMRKPHSCDIENCKCCCKKRYKSVTTSKTIQRSERSRVKNRWHLRLVSRREQHNQNSLINAALVHKPKIKSLNEKEQKRQYSSNSTLKLQCNNKLTHAYYLGKNCFVSIYIRANIFWTLKYLKEMIGLWLSSVPVEKICCLTAYKKYCFKIKGQVHPTVVKFLINSAMNEPNKCASCKNLEIQHAVGAKGVMVPLYLPKYPRHNKPCSKVTIRGFNIMDKEQKRQPYTILNTVIGKTIEKHMKSFLPKTDTSQNLLTNNNTSRNINKRIAPNSINLGIDNFRLGIFPGGKVKILSKTSPDKISTENLKILREIIQHAQNKVLSQDFNPTRIIYVNNLFTQDTQKDQKKQPEAEEASTNILWNILNEAGEVQNQQLNASKNIQCNKSIHKIKNTNLEAVTESKLVPQEPQLNLVRQDKNVYEVLRNISAEKRKQYLISHEFLRNADIDLWENVNILGNEKQGERVVRNNVYDTKENTKRKTCDKGTSPPPKQLRTGSLENATSVVPMASTKTTYLPTTTPNVSTETKQQTQMTTTLTTLPNSILQQSVPTESLIQLQMPNASFSLPENVTVIPIGQLPQELVKNLYQKYAFLPENTQSNNVQAQPLKPINVTEHLYSTTSLLDNSNSIPSLAFPTSVLMNTQAENIENDDADQDDDCILGV